MQATPAAAANAAANAAPRFDQQDVPAWAAALAIGAAFVVMLAWSWGTWPDPAVDYGTQLYFAWQISTGEVLYRDLVYFKGPLSQYVNGALLGIFGVGLRTLVIFNVLVFAGVIVLIYRLGRAFTDRLSATAATVVAVCVFGFIQLMDIGNYNWVTPYAHEYTHGVALSLGMMAALASSARRPRAGTVAIAGLLCGLAFLTTAEVFAAAIGAACVGMFCIARVAPREARVRLIASFAGAALLPPLAGFAALSTAMAPLDALRGTLGSWPWVFNREIGALRFYREGMGTHDVGWSLVRLLQILAGYAALLLPVVVIALLVRTRPRKTQTIVATVSAAVVTLVLLGGWWWFPWHEIARPLPLFVLAIVIVCALNLLRGNSDPALAVRSAFSVFALVLLAKMILNARLRHYGFVLALPATVLLVETLIGWLPRAIGGSLVLRWAGLAACATVTAAQLYGFHLYSRDKTTVVGTGADAFLSDARGDEVNLVLAAIERHAGPDDTLAVLPQGLMLNYLSRRSHPNGYVNFMPPEVIGTGEQKIIAAYDRDPPDLVVMLEEFTTADGFILPEGNYVYGKEMLAWLRRNYEVVDVLRHPRSPAAGFVLLKRQGAAS